MSDVSEEEWKSDLTSILDELDDTQYFRMLGCLGKISGGKKKKKRDVQMPETIIQHYGPLDSILAIDNAMQIIPRNDSKIQNLLRRHVERAKSKPEDDNQGKKRKREEDDSMLTHVTTNHILNQQKSSQADNERSATATWLKSIRDLKSSEILETDGFIGKVVQKSGLRLYRNKENKNKFFFYLGVADDMASVKVKVYGKDLYKYLKEGNSYLFSRALIKEENVVVVTSRSKVCYTKAVVVPEELEQEASELISPKSPALSIQEAKSSPNKTRVTVEGTVTEIDPLNKVTVNYKRQKVKQQRFRLSDETGSICIAMWDEAAVGFCRGLSVGDTVRLSNMKTNEYFEDVSLNSTVNTKLIKLQSVGVQKVRIQIIGIKKATKKETQLEAQLEAEERQQLRTFVVATPLLAKTFGLKATGDFRESLLEAMPLAADAEIQGNKITTITAAL